MFLKKYLSKAENDNREVLFMRALVVCLGAIMLLQTAVMFSMIGNEKTILVPPEINRTFWVSGNAASSEYLEQMAYWYAGLALTITPSSADYQDNLFLKYAAPSSAGQLQADIGAQTDFLKKNNISTQFSVRSTKVDKDNLRVALTGNLDTWTSDKKAGERTVTYMIGFKFINGKLYVSNFKETSDQDPFGDSATTKP